MVRVRKFRHDPRMVAPLAVVAIIISGYAVKQALPGQEAPKVQVRETSGSAPVVQNAVASTATFAASADPFYNARLKKATELTAGDQHGAELQASPTRPPISPLTGELQSSPFPDGRLGAQTRPDARNPGDRTPTPKPGDTVTVRTPEGPALPQYRFSAYLGGKRPVVILVDKDGGVLYLANGELLPSGERLAILSPRLVALKSPRYSRMLELCEEANQ